MDIIPLNIYGPRNQKVSARVRPLNIISDILKWYIDWYPGMCDLSGRKMYEDSHWNVPKMWEAFNPSKDCEVLILEAHDKIQGYIIIKYDHKGYDKKKCLYIPFLAAAPWNRKKRESNGREFRNIGKILVAVAAMKGVEVYDRPVLELHSLKGAQNFYRKLDMEETGREKNSMKEFRLGEEMAFDLIRFLIPNIKIRRLK